MAVPTILAHVFVWIAWLAWIPATLLEKKARGESGGTSLVPVIPLFPLLGSIAIAGLDSLREFLGSRTVGGFHLVILTIMMASCALSGCRILMKK